TGGANAGERLRNLMPRFRFDMDGDRIRSGVEEARHIMIGPLDHEMNIELQGSVFAHRRYDGGPERNVIDEMAIHDVEVQPIGAGFFHSMNLRFEIREIGGENGRSDEDAGHGASFKV